MAGEINFGILDPNAAQNAFAKGQQFSQLQNDLMQQRQAQQLRDIQIQNALREQRMAGEEEAAAKAVGSDYARLPAELMQRGLYKPAMAATAQMSKLQADKLAMLKSTAELMKTTAAGIMANPTFENAVAAVQAFGQRTGTNVAGELDQLTKLGNDPNAIRQWAAGHAVSADKLLPQFQKFDQGGAVMMGRVNPITGEFEQTGAVKKSMAPGEAERIGIDRQRLGLEAQRVGLEGRRVGLAEEEAKAGRETPKLTEAQAKATGFAARAKEADDLLRSLKVSPLAVATKQGLESTIGIGGMLGAAANAFLSPDAQKADQAQRNFVNAILRQESGAAISESEFQNARKQYFPQPGDSKEVIKQKADNRATAIKSLETIAGPGMKAMKNASSAPAAAQTNLDDLLKKYK